MRMSEENLHTTKLFSKTLKHLKEMHDIHNKTTDPINTIEPCQNTETDSKPFYHPKLENEQAARIFNQTRPLVLQAKEKAAQREAHLSQIHRQYKVYKDVFFFKGGEFHDKPAFKDKGHQLTTNLTHPQVCLSMLTMAQGKGWESIKVSGHPDFQREVWMEGTLRGINVKGYKPQEHDLKELADRIDEKMKNHIETKEVNKTSFSPNQSQFTKQAKDSEKTDYAGHSEKEPSAQKSTDAQDRSKNSIYEGVLMEHGKAPFDHNPQNKQSYYVTLQTQHGSKTLWGIGLEAPLQSMDVYRGDPLRLEHLGKERVVVKDFIRDKEGNVIGEEEITTHRNKWQVDKVEEKDQRKKILDAFAESFISKEFKNSDVAQAIIEKINEKFEKQKQEGYVPQVPIYDRQAAPSKDQELAHRERQVEREIERTR